MKKILIIIGVLIFVTSAFLWQCSEIKKLKADRDRQSHNVETLIRKSESYRVSDSLNASRVYALELTAKEYKKMNDADASLIAELKGRNNDLSEINKAQTETIYQLRGRAKDTTIVLHNDTTIVAKCVSHHDKWLDMDICVTENGDYDGKIVCRDSLILIETIRYKRFLGFLWKTHKVKEDRFDMVSKNPHTLITGYEVTKIVR